MPDDARLASFADVKQPAAGSAPVTPHSDAALLAAEAEIARMDAEHDAIGDDKIDDDAFDAYTAAVLRKEQEIRALPAHTIPGIAVRMRLLQFSVSAAGRHSDDARFAASIVDDVARLGSGSSPDLIVTLASELPALVRGSTTYASAEDFDTPKVKAADARIDAIESLIAATEARTIEGAAVQLMIASGRIAGALGVEIEGEGARCVESQMREAGRMVDSVLALIRRTTGDDMARFQISHYAPDYTWPFPSEPIPTPDLLRTDRAEPPGRKVAHPDAELIALAEEYADTNRALDALNANAARISDDAYDAAFDKIASPKNSNERAIAMTPARSLLGIAIKLRQLRRDIGYEVDRAEDSDSAKLADALIAELDGLLPPLSPSLTR